MLKLSNVKVSYGGISALKGIDLAVKKGQLVTLIGANGAGKSTTLQSIMGLTKVESGTITYQGEDITNIPSRHIVKKGIALVPEGRRVFPKLTVHENLLIGGYLRTDVAEMNKDIEWIHTLFPILKDREWQLSGTLSGGEQQMLAVGRALMARPDLIMMDEPSLGLAPLVVQEIFRIMEEIHQNGVTILLIEQNANLALRRADWGYVLETGNIIAEGPGLELLANESIQEAYLGKSRNT